MIGEIFSRFGFKKTAFLLVEEYLGFLGRYIPGYEGYLLRRWIYWWLFRAIGKNAMIAADAYITHSYGITAGEFLTINRGCYIDGRGGIAIGDYVLIGPGVTIVSSNHSLNEYPRMFFAHENKCVSISNNVWIGAHTVICPGVVIGANSVIGAGSVVAKDVSESVLAAGNPAKEIKCL
jgi:acetyltransferase-like isoleucine patch superfamily enzyme